MAGIESEIFAVGRSGIQLPDMVKGAYEGRRAGSRCFPDACLIDVDGVLDLFMAHDSLYGKILMERLQRKILIMLVFLFVHDGSSEDILSVPSLFQEFQSNETLDEFLLFVKELEKRGIHERRLSCS